MKRTRFTHRFADEIPDHVADGVLYVSMENGAAIHMCPCGCGTEVVTPLSPTDWKLIYDGEAVSLYPSIGNWNSPCRSHYWIDEGQVVWAGSMTTAEISRGRALDRQAKNYFYTKGKKPSDGETTIPRSSANPERAQVTSLWRLLRDWWSANE